MYPFQQDTFCRSKCLKFISCRCNSLFLWLDTRFEMCQQISQGYHEIQRKCKHDKFSLLCFKSQELHREATLSEPRVSQQLKQRTNFCKIIPTRMHSSRMCTARLLTEEGFLHGTPLHRTPLHGTSFHGSTKDDTP